MRPQEIVETALAQSDADGCVVIAAEHTETNLRWAGNSLTTNGQMRSGSVTVVSTVDRADGTAAGVLSRSVTTPDELAGLVRAADRAARAAGPAEDAAPLVENYPHEDDWDAPPAETGVDVFERFAPALGSAFGRWRAADRALYGFAEHQRSSYFVGSSTGLRRRFDQPDGRIEINGKSADLTRSAWAGAHTVDFTDVDVQALTEQLAERLALASKRIELPAGRYETILPPSAVADLMIYAYWAASARDAEEGRSVYAHGGPPSNVGVAAGGGGRTRIGERLCHLPLRLHSDPSYPGLECAPFEIVTESAAGLRSVFDNGSPAASADWVRDGTLTDLPRTRAWAARTGAAARPLVDNLVLGSTESTPGNDRSVEDLVAATERGLLLTCLWYIREVDPQTLLLTGLTRDGVYLVENGRISGAVNNFRFNESPIDLLGRVSEAGRTERTLSREWSDYFTRTAMPAVRVPDFNMSTVSQAS